MKERILMKRKYLLATETPYWSDKKMNLYYAAKLLNQFGVLVDKPELVTQAHVERIGELFGVNIPMSFYSNPQDMRYFTCRELLIEQVVSYMFTYGEKMENDSQRIELFKKALPNYQEGKEVVFREYKIINSFEAREVLTELAKNLGAYSRKWSESEAIDFEWLYKNLFVSSKTEIKGKDNAVEMFNKYPVALFAKSFDRKDVVKLSVEMIGEESNFSYTESQRKLLFMASQYCKQTPVSKKQAKFFNTILKKVGVRTLKVTNAGNADKIATQYMKQGRILEAAQVYAKTGSMLTRRIVWLLSRANPREAVQILDMIKVTNPLVTMQFLQGLLDQSNGPRAFSFYSNRQVVRHMETEYEAKWRKSILSAGTKKLIKEETLRKVDNFYKELPKLGKVYIDDAFKKIAVPFNTSADGEGIEGAPTGTRQPITDDFIRAFVYWKNVRDIDSSVVFVHKNGKTDKLYWGNYHGKPFGHSALTSGDDTSSNGMEYIDFKLSELEALGYEFGIYQLNGYGGDFSKADAYCGYQNKSDLNTKAWDAKNMALKIKLPQARSREYVGFILDIKNREVIVINQMQSGNDRVVSTKIVDYLKKYMNSDYVKQFNIYKIASLRGEVVTDPALADIVFSDSYVLPGNVEVEPGVYT
ncbi:hypothetical protein DRO61_05675, partial [Candidatus Bathyarchaeota archaeon]